ncbi:hypothetical protein OH492_14585 [Vibrio chagasii]|nr:hypothetical protein [Vibrio chagasii]
MMSVGRIVVLLVVGRIAALGRCLDCMAGMTAYGYVVESILPTTGANIIHTTDNKIRTEQQGNTT